MLEYISGSIGLLWDITLFGGIFLFLMSFLNRFRQYKRKFIIAGPALVVLGIAFTDHIAAYDAFMRGFEPYDAFMSGFKACYNG